MAISHVEALLNHIGCNNYNIRDAQHT